MIRFRFILLLFILWILNNLLHAEVRLPAIFADDMVLQQESEVAIWGWTTKTDTIIISPSWSSETLKLLAESDGHWKTYISTPKAGGPYEIIISDGSELVIRNILIGEVWLCSGQSNMEMPMKGFKGQPVAGSNEIILRSKNDHIRFISIPRAAETKPQEDFSGSWKTAQPEMVANFSATAYYFGKLLYDILGVPIGLIDVSYGGSCIEAWMSPATSQNFEDTKIPKQGDSILSPNRTPTVLFNGMLNPVVGYTIKGAIWYQGETNYINAEQYTKLFTTMVEEWRMLWDQGNFPFYYAQIAPFDYSVFHTADDYEEKYNSAYLREAQFKAMNSIPNSGMAVLLDIGEKDNIHPMNKEAGGHRLAYWALAKTYGIEGFGYSSPTLKEMNIKDNTIILSFDNAPNGITSFGKEITLFEVAGENRQFFPAKAVLARKSVVVYSEDVPKPVAVRYAFRDFVIGELFSTEGLPVSSFRTDEWVKYP